jgi:hypothetical protein
VHRNSFCSTVLLGLIPAFVTPGSAASAQVIVNAAAKSQFAQALKFAYQLLVTADRDYGGPRALAAQEVRKAMGR